MFIRPLTSSMTVVVYGTVQGTADSTGKEKMRVPEGDVKN